MDSAAVDDHSSFERHTTRTQLGLGLVVLIAARLAAAAPTAESPTVATHRNGFDDAKPSWRISANGTNSARPRLHQRSTRLVHAGAQAELVQIDAARRGGQLFLEQAVPPALVFDELTASLWVRSNRPGLQMGVRIVFPNQPNPRTGEPLTVDFWGDRYADTLRWQRLQCGTNDEAIRQLLGRVRNQVAGAIETVDIDSHGMYVDRIVLVHELEAGASEYALDELEVAPFIDPASNGAAIVQAGAEQEQIAPVTMGDGRLLRDGRPLLPIFTQYHGEPLEQLRDQGFNLLLIPRYDDLPLLRALSDAGLGAMCEPPALEVRPPEATGDVAYNVGLPKFTAETANILLWHLGAETPPEALASVRAAANAVRDADQYRRPILVDVRGNVREFHRSVDVIGFSKHAVQTSVSPADYLQFLQQESLSALRGKPTFTWVFTEPNPASLTHRPAQSIAPQLEPEQIWMQVYAALGSGAKAIGYWNWKPLTNATPADVERTSAVTLANLQLHLLRDWLATGKVVDVAPVRMGTTRAPGPPTFAQGLLSSYTRLASQTGPADQLDARLRAPVIRCDQGLVILPQWLEPDGQYQPGPMSAQDVRILLRGVGGVTQAWEVTTTGIYAHELQIDETNGGGTEIRLKRLDQLAAIVIPTDQRFIDSLRRDAAAIRQLGADNWIRLAETKFERVVAVHDALRSLEPPPQENADRTLADLSRRLRDADNVLAAARRSLQQATQLHSSSDHDGVRVAAEDVLRLTRIVQRAHWEYAVRGLSSPVSTPYTVCFQTLPDYWKLIQALGRGRPGTENLLRGGSFEDWDNLLAAGWQHRTAPPEANIETRVELASDGVSGRSLRLAARPVRAEEAPAVLDQPPVLFVTHPMSVSSGQTVHIRGQVRIDSPVTASRDGLILYDNLTGSVGALRWLGQAPVGSWLPFELIRPVTHSGELRLTIELTGFGDVRIDELQVTTIGPE